MPLHRTPPAPSPAKRLPSRLYERDKVQGLVPLSLVQALARYLSSKGVEAAQVIPRRLLQGAADQGHGRLDAEDYCHMLIAAAERLCDPLLGLHLGQQIQVSELGALGYALQACENLGAAFLRIQRYHRLVHDINPMEHTVTNGHLELRWGIAHGKPGALFDEAGIASIVQFGRALCGQPLEVSEIDFVNPPPDDIGPYQAYFGGRIRFAQPATRLVMPLSALSTPLLQTDPTLRALMESQVDVALARLPQTGELGDITRRVVAHLAPYGMPELEAVAQELRLSPRMLYRRLAQQQLNFRTLREEALQQLAEMHLRDDGLTLSEVAALLGYSEQSAFSRAFKRWTGVSPLQWRIQKIHKIT